MTAPSPRTAHYHLRSDLRAALRKDLLGPHGTEQEVLTDDAPITAYPIGVLFPQPSADDIDAQQPLTLDEEDGVDTPPDVVAGD
ncbi:hypothetical protein, partial [Streptomyces recifensis]|uniref:hypothetical protein n=1 Tax=Streptomyces recifensis TaxID=67355 RepID=UPI00111DA4AC